MFEFRLADATLECLKSPKYYVYFLAVAVFGRSDVNYFQIIVFHLRMTYYVCVTVLDSEVTKDIHLIMTALAGSSEWLESVYMTSVTKHI